MENARKPLGVTGVQVDQRLDSWKEIAAYVGRDVRTVQRWEKEEGLPVHRHSHKKLGTVYGFKPEIDSWWASRRAILETKAPPKPSRRRWMILGATAAVALIAGGAWFRIFRAGEPAAAARVVPLTTYPGDVGGGTFSPDGSQVAFSWNGKNQDNHDIYVKVLGEETPHQLTTDPAADGFPAWSPDGSHIAFGRSKQPWSAPASIYLIPAVGGPERLLAELVPVEHYVPIAGLAWSPDGKWLAFPDLTSQEGPFSLHGVSPESGKKQKLTSPPPLSLGDGLPAFSPDGRMLAFVRASSYESADIYLMPASGGEPKRLTTDATWLWGLCWTADSQELIFSSGREYQQALWRIPARGGTPQRVPDTSGSDVLFALSRNGRRLTFTRTVSDENIWQAGVRGSALVGRPSRLISSTRGDSNAQYSPNGRRIAFASNRSGNWEIWVCNSDGSDPVPLTHFGAGASSWPSWSPDGRRIAFNSTARGDYNIYTVSVDGGAPQQLTVDPAGNAGPNWSADGWIYFASNRSGELQVWKIPADGGVALQLTKQGGVIPSVSPDGRFVYYAKGEDEVWRIPTAGGEEARFMDGVEDSDHGRWVPVDSGFYFVQRNGSKRALKFLDFTTGRTSDVMPLDKPWDVFALAVSPDRVLYSQIDYTDHDLMMVENFR